MIPAFCMSYMNINSQNGLQLAITALGSIARKVSDSIASILTRYFNIMNKGFSINSYTY